jgi:hypothetical protein
MPGINPSNPGSATTRTESRVDAAIHEDPSISLHGFLTRLIWLCVLPLVLLAAYLAIDRVRATQSERDLEATNLANTFATAIDQSLVARIEALQVLAASPLADNPSDWNELYRQAQAFPESMGSHVIFADRDMRMLFNTRVPFGTPLPSLPRPKGHGAAPRALETGKPAVGDTVFGPIANEPLVAIAVPGMREGKAAFVVLAVLESREFQDRLEQVLLPAGWSLALVDGNGVVIARRAPDGLDAATEADAAERFVVKSAVSPWSMALEIPHEVYREPMVAAAAALVVALLGATLAAVLGGTLAGRRLGKSVASLADTPAPGAPAPDITEIAAVRRLLDESMHRREAAELSQHESEQRFRVTFEQAAMGIALVAPNGRWLRVNRKLCDIVGYSREELLARTFRDITHPDDVDADFDNMGQVLAGEIDTFSREKRYLRKGGAIVWINVTVALVRRPDGTPDYFISLVEDIQRRKEAQAALKASETDLRNAQRLAGIGSWTWNLRTDRHTWSEEVYRIYGRDPSLPPAIYPEVQEYFTPDSWARLAAAVETGLAKGTPYECDAEIVRPDGTRGWITARGEATHDAGGAVVELHGTVQDITERQQAAEALRELNATLEQRVERRTAELTAANKELDSFAHAASHDLQAPLQRIDGFARILEEGYGALLDETGRNALRRTRVAARTMGDLIDDLLDLSRLTRSDMTVETVDLSALARPIAGELKEREPGRDAVFEIAPKLEVRGDRRLLAALLDNLFGNAWKYTGKHASARIELGVMHDDREPVYFVRDDGAGFDMAHATNLFAPFRRMHSASDFPGTGIGLATAQRIVQRHGGRIWAEGAVEKGATIYFTISA